MKLICSVALALGILTALASSREGYLSAGLGATSCGQLIQGYKQDPSGVEAGMVRWAQGFMTGANVADVQRIEPLRHHITTGAIGKPIANGNSQTYRRPVLHGTS